jgi:hypothetical protein
VGAGAGGPHRERPQGRVELAAQRRQLLDGAVDAGMDAGLDLQRRAVRLRREALAAGAGQARRTLSIRCASAQLVASSSITSSSIPNV